LQLTFDLTIASCNTLCQTVTPLLNCISVNKQSRLHKPIFYCRCRFSSGQTDCLSGTWLKALLFCWQLLNHTNFATIFSLIILKGSVLNQVWWTG